MGREVLVRAPLFFFATTVLYIQTVEVTANANIKAISIIIN